MKIKTEQNNAIMLSNQGNTRGAAVSLKKKRSYESQLHMLMNQSLIIEQQIISLEGMDTNLQAMKVLKTGSDTMKSIHNEMNIDTVDNTMLDIQGQMDIEKELSMALSQPLDNGIGNEEEEEIMEELELIKAKEVEIQLLRSKTPTAFLGHYPLSDKNPQIYTPNFSQISNSPITSSPKESIHNEQNEDDIMKLEASML